MSYEPILKLPAGPIDIVGDVHGHLEPLTTLREQLGYDERGVHPKGRRLVFVGDLCDRGPDSPGVFEWVMNAVEEGGAVCLLGNHELALIDTDENERQKAGNAWFFGNEDKCQKDEEDFGEFARVRPGQRARIEAFCDLMPIAIEHPEVQIVHACWDEVSLEFVTQLGAGSNREVVAACNARATERLKDASLERRFPAAKLALEARRRNGNWRPTEDFDPALPELIEALVRGEEIEQRYNPIKVLTSGLEKSAPVPRWLGQKWRFLDRVAWWDDAALSKPTLFGHYWRQREHWPEGPYDQHAVLFGAARAEEWLGRDWLAMCVDYRPPGSWRDSVLGAYRVDLQELVFWDGRRVASGWGRA